MKKKILFIVGKGEHGKLVQEVAQLLNCYSDIRFIDDNKNKKALGTTADLPILNQSCDKMGVVFIAIGDNKTRRKLYSLIKKSNIPLATLIHPTACIGQKVIIEENVYVGSKAIVNSGTTLKKGAVINSGCIVEHDNIIGEFAHLAPGVITGGGVVVGNSTFIGLGSIINDHLEIADEITVGSGSVITQSFMNSHKILVGIPAHEK